MYNIHVQCTDECTYLIVTVIWLHYTKKPWLWYKLVQLNNIKCTSFFHKEKNDNHKRISHRKQLAGYIIHFLLSVVPSFQVRCFILNCENLTSWNQDHYLFLPLSMHYQFICCCCLLYRLQIASLWFKQLSSCTACQTGFWNIKMTSALVICAWYYVKVPPLPSPASCTQNNVHYKSKRSQWLTSWFLAFF